MMLQYVKPYFAKAHSRCSDASFPGLMLTSEIVSSLTVTESPYLWHVRSRIYGQLR